eukprot:3673462-Lingulodinium_polyedra.AAC.1
MEDIANQLGKSQGHELIHRACLDRLGRRSFAVSLTFMLLSAEAIEAALGQVMSSGPKKQIQPPADLEEAFVPPPPA